MRFARRRPVNGDVRAPDMSSEPMPVWLQPQWFLPLFVVMWLLMTGLLAHLGGWASLASMFRAQDRISGERFRFASGTLGRRFLPVSYGNCLFVTINSQGLYLSILFPFRFQSPPLFVPWSRVQSIQEKRILSFRYWLIEVRDHWSRITLRGAPGRRAKEAYEAARGTMTSRGDR